MLATPDFLIDHPAMDLISDVLRDLRLASAVLSLSEFRAPWGVAKGAVGGAPFHAILEGRCFIAIGDDAPVELQAGDLVVLPHGASHALFSAPDVPRTPFKQVLEANGVRPAWTPATRLKPPALLTLGGEGALTRAASGVFSFRESARNHLLDALPPLIHVRGRDGQAPAWLQSSLRLLVDEAASEDPGSLTIAERAADIMFVQAVRHAIQQAPTATRGWLRGLSDAPIARALARIHDRPGAPWTVASLAKEAGMSRTVFAARFSECVGQSVMDYVTAQRMRIAADLLAESDAPIARIANEVAYESDISFSKAFRRWAGSPPGQYRRRIAAALKAAE